MYIDFEIIRLQSDKDFKRDVGISLENFHFIRSKIKSHIDDVLNEKPMRKRGLKPSISLENQLLITLYYLRHYPTFIKLGQSFGISESYTNKIYHKILDIMVKVLHVSNRKELLNKDLDTIVMDVTEQPIERPVQNQKPYYSGKKKTHD